MATPLYRIISFEGLMSLLMNKQERYVRPIDCWEDTYEGFLLHLMDNENGLKEIIHTLYAGLMHNDVNLTIDNFVRLQHARYACFGQCWSRNKDSDAMWRIYSYNRKAVQLVTDRQRIQKVVGSQFRPTELIIANVKYDINSDEDAKKLLKVGAKFSEPFFHKRAAFSHEKETRVLIHVMSVYNTYDNFRINMFRRQMKWASEDLDDEAKILETYHRLSSETGYPFTIEKEIFVDIPSLEE